MYTHPRHVVTDTHAHSTSLPSGRSCGPPGRSRPSRLAGRTPMARARSPPRVVHRVHRSHLHRLRCGRRQTKGHRRREHGRRRIRRPRLRGRHRISLVARSRLRSPWHQRLLAAPNRVRCRHPVVAPVLRQRRLPCGGGPRHRGRVRNVLQLSEPSASESRHLTSTPSVDRQETISHPDHLSI